MTIGVLPFADLKTALNLNTGFFETSQYTLNNQMAMTSGNHDQAGMSAGNLQYNYGPADRLQELWAFMVTNHPTVVQSSFGANTAEHAEFVNVTNTYTRAQRVTWADSISIPTADGNNKRFLYEPWKSIFATLLIQPETMAKYFQMSDVYYFPNPYDVFRQLSCKSRAALAGLFDITVNKGRYYPFNLIQADFDEIDANEVLTETEKEAQKVYQINFRGNEEENALNDSSSAVFWVRRGCMANQGGDYYGANYDPENQFDINQEPATDEKAATTATGLNIKLGLTEVNNVFLGTIPIEKIYSGIELLTGGASVEPYTTTKIPQTQFRTNAGNYAGIGAVSAISLAVNQPLWIDVQNYVACRTYYTTDGSTPTVNSALYTEALKFTSSCTLKVLTVSIFGYAEAVKTLTINIAVAPTTTISPSATVQNNIPITVTLATSEIGAAIKYKLGSSATVYDYTAPFQVNQTSAGVLSTNIKVTYWAVGANATEAEKSITYDTANAVPVAPIVTATPIGARTVALSWDETVNTTSYTIYRSTISGQLGTILAGTQWMTGTSWNDTTVVEGTIYYYTVQAGNFGRVKNSAQVSAIPVETLYRYVRYQGYGDQTNAATTRLVEIQAMEGATNRLSGKVPISGEVVSSGGTIDKATDSVTAMTSGTYPLWWVGAGVPNLVYDLGAAYPIDTLKLWMFSTDVDPRQTRFKLFVSNDNVNWIPIVDMSGNTTVQPANGWAYTL